MHDAVVSLPLVFCQRSLGIRPTFQRIAFSGRARPFLDAVAMHLNCGTKVRHRHCGLRIFRHFFCRGQDGHLSFVKIEKRCCQNSHYNININIYIIVSNDRVPEIENDQMTMTTLTLFFPLVAEMSGKFLYVIGDSHTELTGKQHKDVLKAIRNMEQAWEKVNGSNFRLVEYQDQKGEFRPCYQLTKTECLYIATKFNDEARAKLVLRCEELETAEVRRRKIT